MLSISRLLSFAFVFLVSTACVSEPDLTQDRSQSKRQIAISFDDAPMGEQARGDWDRAAALIEALAQADVEAVFFVTTRGFDTEQYGRERIRRYGEAGHAIANHTHTHPWLYQSDADAYLADIDIAERSLEGLPNRRAWFRYPYLDQGRRDVTKRSRVKDGLKQRDLFEAYVTVDTYDWHLNRRWRQSIRDGFAVDKAALERVYTTMVVDAAEHGYTLADDWLPEQPMHVLLLHENDAAASFIGAAISGLREAGWEIVSPDLAYANPLPQPDIAIGYTGGGRVASLAFEAGASGAETFDHWSASEDGLDKRLNREGAFSKPE